MSVPKCMFNYELLLDYASGNVDSRERAIAEKHLAQCPDCRREVMEMEQTWWALDVWQEEVEPVKPNMLDLRQRIDASHKQEETLQRWADRMRQAYYGMHLRPALAFATVAAALMILPWNRQGSQDLSGSSYRTAQDNQIQEIANLPQPTVTIASANTGSPTDSQMERDFQRALEQSAGEKQSHQMLFRVSKAGQLQDLQFTSVGFTPNADVVPVYPSNEQSLQPSALMSETIGLR